MSPRARSTPSARRPVRRAARRFVIAISVLNAMAILVVSISPWFRVDAVASLQVLLTLVGAMVVAELRPPGREGPATDLARAVSWILAAALVLLGSPHLAVITLTTTTLVGELLRRESPVQGFFNSSQLSLSIVAGATIIRLFEQHESLTPTGNIAVSWVPSAVLAGLSVIFVNGLLTGIMRSLSTRSPMVASIRAAVDDTMRNEGVLLTLAPVMAVLAVRSPLLLPMPLVTALAVYRKANEASAQQEAASHDNLTGLPNRREFERATQLALDAHAFGAVALIDLDGFKAINDHLGHQAGDEVLQMVAERISGLCRPTDIPARLGGDEFAVFLHGLSDEVEEIAQQLVAAIRQPGEALGSAVTIGASLGLALTPAHGTQFQTLLQRADATMYQAKRQMLGVAVYDPGSTADSTGRASLRKSLQEALAVGAFDAHYQPWVDGRTGTVLGIECLARWPVSEDVLLTPDQFLPLIRHPDLALDLTLDMLDRALACCSAWKDVGFTIPVSVNVPLVTARSGELVDAIEALLYRFPLDPGLLQLEISDRGLTADDPDLIENLARLRGVGVGLIIDDFGSGPDSLAILADLGANTVKLTTRLTHGMLTRPGALTVFTHLTSMGNELGLTVVAKHIETAEEAQAITHAGGAIQGHLVCPARPASHVAGWLVDRQNRRSTEVRDPTAVPPSSW